MLIILDHCYPMLRENLGSYEMAKTGLLIYDITRQSESNDDITTRLSHIEVMEEDWNEQGRKINMKEGRKRKRKLDSSKEDEPEDSVRKKMKKILTLDQKTFVNATRQPKNLHLVTETPTIPEQPSNL